MQLGEQEECFTRIVQIHYKLRQTYCATLSTPVKNSFPWCVRREQVAADSVLLNHSWRHLWSSPATHFKKTMLTR